jgi:hypothetical protein
MQIFIKHNKTHTYNVDPNTLVKDLRKLISTQEKILPEYFFLVHNGKIIESGNISDYKVEKDSTIHVNIRPVPVKSEFIYI